MAAKIWIGIRSRTNYLRRLSVVFASELRLKIVTELYMREMSPKQFYEEFGGGSMSRVRDNFEKLAENGWLRYIRSEGPGGKRHGGVERFYRATELAFCDFETWALLPYSIRVASSWNSFKQIAQRIREAMEALAFGAHPDRHLTCTQPLLDQLGWSRVIEAVDARFVSLYEEQDDARLRVVHSGEELIRANVVLIAFELAMRGDGRIGPSLVESPREDLVPFPVRVSKVFADEICVQIIEEANLREISAKQFHAELGGDSVDGIRRRFRMLEGIGWLTQIDGKTGGSRRGATEKFYRAAGPAIRDIGPWDDVPDSLKGSGSWTTFEQLCEAIKEAMVAGTFDAREDRYLTWSLLGLDRQGWEKVAAAIEDLLAFVLEEQERAKVRMKKSGEKPIAMMVALSAFESSGEPAKEL